MKEQSKTDAEILGRQIEATNAIEVVVVAVFVALVFGLCIGAGVYLGG